MKLVFAKSWKCRMTMAFFYEYGRHDCCDNGHTFERGLDGGRCSGNLRSRRRSRRLHNSGVVQAACRAESDRGCQFAPDAVHAVWDEAAVLVLSAWLHYALGNTLSQIVEVFNFHIQMPLPKSSADCSAMRFDCGDNERKCRPKRMLRAVSD